MLANLKTINITSRQKRPKRNTNTNTNANTNTNTNIMEINCDKNIS